MKMKKAETPEELVHILKQNPVVKDVSSLEHLEQPAIVLCVSLTKMASLRCIFIDVVKWSIQKELETKVSEQNIPDGIEIKIRLVL